MSEVTSDKLTPFEPREITVHLQKSLALRDLPTEEPFPPAYPEWKSYASFRHVNALAAGHDELWAATWGGVVRWRFENHGNRITFTRFASEHGLPGGRFQCIALDVHGHPWVGGPRVGLNTFDGERWHTFTTEDGLPSNDILCVANGADGRLWAGSKRGLGYIALDGESLRWRHKSLDAINLPAEEIRALALDRDATLWLGTDWGLYQLRPDTASRRYTERDGLPCLQVTQLVSDGQGHLWVGTAAGLCLLDGDRLEPCQGLDMPILSLTAEPGGALLWVVTPEGIGACKPEGLETIKPHQALAEEAQGRAVAIDASRRRWFGYTEGVTQQFPPRVLLSSEDLDQMTRGENSLSNCVTAIQVDATGRVWVGTPEGLWFKEHNTWRKCEPGIELSASLVNVQAIAISPRTKKLWIGGWREDGPQGDNGSGLRRLIGTTEVPLAGEMPELPYVDTLTCDAHGRVWGAAEGVVHCFDGQQWKQLPPLPDEALGEVIRALTVDARDVLWCGTTGGLWRYDREWHREEVDMPVQALAHKGKDLWVGTPVGLKRSSGRRKKRWVDVDSLANVSITALVIGHDGTVWAGTTRGLARIGGNDYQVFTAREDGLADNAVQALAWDGDALWIGTVNGISCFTIDQSS